MAGQIADDVDVRTRPSHILIEGNLSFSVGRDHREVRRRYETRKHLPSEPRRDIGIAVSLDRDGQVDEEKGNDDNERDDSRLAPAGHRFTVDGQGDIRWFIGT